MRRVVTLKLTDDSVVFTASIIRAICPDNEGSKSCPTTRHGGAWGERRYSSYSFSTSALDGGQWSASRPGRALAPGKGPPVAIVQEAGWAPEPVWSQGLEEKSFRLCWRSNLDRPVVQPVARHYTDWATQLLMEAVSTSKTSANFYETTQHNIPNSQLLLLY
jgi:hypothetical protein